MRSLGMMPKNAQDRGPRLTDLVRALSRAAQAAATVALLLAAPACSSSAQASGGKTTTTTSTTGATSTTPCQTTPTTIEAYCAERTCATYDQVVAYARKGAKEPGLFRYDIGTCGSYRYVRTQVSMGMGTDYFDANGQLVKTDGVADAPRCDGTFSSSIGDIPPCTEQSIEKGEAPPPEMPQR